MLTSNPKSQNKKTNESEKRKELRSTVFNSDMNRFP